MFSLNVETFFQSSKLVLIVNSFVSINLVNDFEIFIDSSFLYLLFLEKIIE
jgi:hypothetical protein